MTLPVSLAATPRLGRWLRVNSGGWVEVFSGKVEIGQGILTALAQVVATTMGIGLDQVRMVAANTDVSPDEGVTSGSLSVQHSGAALRQVATEARALYLARAAETLSCDGEMQVERGMIRGEAGQTSYWELADDALLARDASGSPAAVAMPGGSNARTDLPDKIFGRPRFIHDLTFPGLLHGRMVRLPSPAARLIVVDAAPIEALPDVVAVVRDGSLLGVLANSEAATETAATALAAACRWDVPPSLPDADDLPHWLRTQPAETSVVADGPPSWSPGNQPPVVRTLRHRFAKPYLAHASIGPSCALAQFGERLHVWSHSQAIFNLRRDLALALKLPETAVMVQHVEGAGCYGHNPADDVAFDAAWLARAAGGRPVRVQWSRSDELGCAPFGPAMAVEIEADLDAAGGIVDWRHTIWSNGHGTRPGRGSSPALLGAWAMADPFERQSAVNAPLAAGGGAERNAAPSYALPSWRVTNHRVLPMPLRSSALRSLGALLNVFAAEQMVDEVALAAGQDLLAWRILHAEDDRGRAVLERAASEAGWGSPLPDGVGRGIGFARYKNTGAYCAVVAEIEAAAEIRVRRLTVACDVGLAVDPDGVANQMEGGAIQATSWVLKEEVRFDRMGVTSTDWDAYPILRFSEVPAVSVHIVSSAAPSLGAGEASVGPTAAAIGNAVASALGVRVRQLPLRADRVIAAFDEDGEAVRR